MKRVIAFILLMCCIPLSGCWDRKELDEIGIVYAVACDKNPDTGKIILTSQVLRPSAFIQNGRFTESTVENVTTEGDTIIDAFREAASQFDRTLFYSHNKLFIFSEEIAREGIAPYIDALLRGRESRDSVYIFIAKGTPAQNLLGVKHGIDIVSGTSLEKLIKNNKTRRGGTSSVNLIELVKKIFGEGINPVVGTMEIVEQPIMPIEKLTMATPEAIKISSDAVFKKDKMIGFLSEQESRGVNWVLGNVKGGLIIVSSLQEQNKPVTIEISKAASNIDPEIIENQITFKVSINIEATMQEKQSQGTEFSAENLFNEYDYLQKLADETSKVVQKEIVAALAKTQGEYKSDVFGFGSALNRKFPQIWDENKDKWDEEFPKVHVIIRVQTVIKRTGQLMGSFKYP